MVYGLRSLMGLHALPIVSSGLVIVLLMRRSLRWTGNGHMTNFLCTSNERIHVSSSLRIVALVKRQVLVISLALARGEYRALAPPRGVAHPLLHLWTKLNNGPEEGRLALMNYTA